MYRAKDNYSIGKHRTVTSEELEKNYSGTIPSSNKQFICPECGDYLAFVRRHKYKSYFRHCNSNDRTKDCDLRSQSNQSIFIYERVGLPLYIKSCNNNIFELYLGFYNIDEKSMKTAKTEEFKISISSINMDEKQSVSYLVNDINFSISTITLKRINFASQMYKLKYSSTNAQKLLKERWGNQVEGVLNEGTLFTYGESGGRKIRVNDEVTTDTDYYYLCKNSNRISRYAGIEYQCCGEIVLNSSFANLHYNVYKIKFKVHNDEQFKKIFHFCRDSFKISLIYKPSTLISMWPPIIHKDNEILNFDDVNENLFVFKSDEMNACIFYHEDNVISEFKGVKLDVDKYLIKMPVKTEKIAININEKYNSIFIFMNRYASTVKTYENDFYIKDNDNNFIERKTYEELPPKKTIKITADSKCDILHFKNEQLYRHYEIKNEKCISIDNIDFEDEIISISGIDETVLLKYKKNKKCNVDFFNDELIYKNISKFEGPFIAPPVWIKKLLLLLKNNSKTFLLVRKFLFLNKIPMNTCEILRNLYESMKAGVNYGK